MKKIICNIQKFFNRQYINLPKTVFANFMLLNFCEAIKFPILIYGSCKLYCLSGKVKFTEPLKTGMLKIGISDSVRSFHNKSYIDIRGQLICGQEVVLRKGISLQIYPMGNVELESYVYVGDNNTIISMRKIKIGYATRVGNNTTFMDTDFHFIVNTSTGVVKSAHGFIDIGVNNWVGGNCIVKKGAQTPKGTILAGPYSMISKNYKDKIPEFSIIAGSPAKLLVENMRRINNDKYQKIMAEHFRKTNEPYTFTGCCDFDEICLPEKK